ncbi:MAG: calcium-binding protein, partial [Pseudomonadota bacterium]
MERQTATGAGANDPGAPSWFDAALSSASAAYHQNLPGEPARAIASTPPSALPPPSAQPPLPPGPSDAWLAPPTRPPLPAPPPAPAQTRGGPIADRLVGSDASEQLFGNAGADTLVGGNGHDTLVGGRGADVLMGGTGQDFYAVYGESLDGSTDVISDQDDNNSLQLRNIEKERVKINRAGDDLVLSILGVGASPGGRIIVEGHFADRALTEVSFSDGTVWDRKTLADYAEKSRAALEAGLVQAFGDKAADDALADLSTLIEEGRLPLPSTVLEVADTVLPEGVMGGYVVEGGGTVFIRASLADAARRGVPGAYADLIAITLEEIGHHIDHYYFGGADATGDEGAIFARVMLRGGPLGEAELSVLRGEDSAGERGVVSVGGRKYDAEFFGSDSGSSRVSASEMGGLGGGGAAGSVGSGRGASGSGIGGGGPLGGTSANGYADSRLSAGEMASFGSPSRGSIGGDRGGARDLNQEDPFGSRLTAVEMREAFGDAMDAIATGQMGFGAPTADPALKARDAAFRSRLSAGDMAYQSTLASTGVPVSSGLYGTEFAGMLGAPTVEWDGLSEVPVDPTLNAIHPALLYVGAVGLTAARTALRNVLRSRATQLGDLEPTVVDPTSTGRPSWKKSEDDVGLELPAHYEKEPTFLNGDPAARLTKGSSRPDFYSEEDEVSIEVKNRLAETPAQRSRLANNVA